MKKKKQVRRLELKESQGTGFKRWLHMEDTGYGATVSTVNEENWIDVSLSERQLRSVRNWINKKLGEENKFGAVRRGINIA